MKNWDGAWSCYITSKCQPMTQVTSKTSWGLPKVHLRTYNRSLGGLVVKWECAERVKVTQNGQKYCFFWSKNGCLWEKPMAQEMSKTSKGLSKVHFWSCMRCLGGLAVKWERPKGLEWSQNELKNQYFLPLNDYLWRHRGI